jgi:hypothetical protein
MSPRADIPDIGRVIIAKTFPFAKTFHAYTPKTLRAEKSLQVLSLSLSLTCR